MKAFWRLYLKVSGWKTDFSFPFHHIKKYIIIVGPHTSNWDFVIGLAYRNLLGLNNVKFLGKKELFKPPFGFVFKSIGGIPVDRQSSHHVVEDAVKFFKDNTEFAIALSPEGTRKRVPKLRTGFYYIALTAGVPIIMVGLDYKNKTLLFGEPVKPSGDIHKDLDLILQFYRPIYGKNPELGLMEM